MDVYVYLIAEQEVRILTIFNTSSISTEIKKVRYYIYNNYYSDIRTMKITISKS